MKLYVDQIPDDGLELDYSEPSDAFSYLKETEGGLSVNTPVQVTLVAKTGSGRVTLRGMLKGSVTMSCGRCLKPFAEDISHDFHYDCLPESAMKEEAELTSEDADICYYPGGEIDITALVQEQVGLAVPMRPLCREDCKGLCPKCGADLNQGECGCEKGPKDLRFAALRDLKIKD